MEKKKEKAPFDGFIAGLRWRESVCVQRVDVHKVVVSEREERDEWRDGRTDGGENVQPCVRPFHSSIGCLIHMPFDDVELIFLSFDVFL